MEREEHIIFRLKAINNLLRRRHEGSQLHSDTQRLTGMHGWILGYLFDHTGEDIFQRDIETRFSMRRSTVSGVLQLMEKNGLLIREEVAEDRRLKRLIPTERAACLHARILAEIDSTEALLRQNISDEELATFCATLNKMKKNLSDTLPASPAAEEKEAPLC